MALNRKKVAEKNKADAMIDEIEKETSVNHTIDDLNTTESPPNSEKKQAGNIPDEHKKNRTTAEAGKAQAGKDPAGHKDDAPASEEKKHPGGRPSYESQGITKRKQYTLTLEPGTYQDILNRARDEKMSFAKYVERAVSEYIKSHS